MNLLVVETFREVTRNARRSAAIVLLVALALTGTLGLRAAEVLVSSELERSFVATQPASVVLRTATIDQALLDEVSLIPGVKAAEARATRQARAVAQNGTLVPFNLTVVMDPTDTRVDRFSLESTVETPGIGEVWVESASLPVVGIGSGEPMTLQVGSETVEVIAGEAIDEGAEPGEVEQEVFAYSNPSAANALGLGGGLDQLRITTEDGISSAAVLGSVSAKLEALDRTITFRSATDFPEHPHAAQMNSITAATRTFSLLVAFAAAVLLAQVAAGVALAARRQMGILSLIGATRTRILARQLLLFLPPTLLGTLIGLPAGLWLGGRVAVLALSQLSIRAESTLAPLRTTALATAAVVTVALGSVAVSSWLAGARSVSDSLSLSPPSVDNRRWGSGLWAYPLRSLLRRPVRFLAVVVALATSGAMVLASLSVRTGWERAADDLVELRSYDVAIVFEPGLGPEIEEVVASAFPTTTTERWSISALGTATNPDEPVGDMGSLVGLSPATAVVSHQVSSGTWLTGEPDEAVFDQRVAADLGASVGDRIALPVFGVDLEFTVVGIAQRSAEIAPSVFVDLDALENRLGDRDLADIAFVQRSGNTEGTEATVQRAELAEYLDAELASAGIIVGDVQTIDERRSIIADHIIPLAFVLLLLGFLAAVIAIAGVAITGEANAQERRRELAVLRLVGATGDRLASLFALEAALTAVVAALLSMPAGLLASRLLAAPIGRALLGQPVSVSIGLWPSVIWLLVCTTFAVAAMALGTRSLLNKQLTNEVVL